MPWQEITFELSTDQIEAFEDALLSLGALSVTLRDAANQPLMEPPPGATPLWNEILLTAMFESTVDADSIASDLWVLLQLSGTPKYKAELLEDREWRRTWMDHFEPIRFGRRLWICPSGYERPKQQDAVIVDLDPGLAFGTGSHPTTALCMTWLDGHAVSGKTVVDFGCGSGLLAIAAARLGAARVFAIDNDPQAILATQENAENNQVQDIVSVCETQDIAPASVDILLANILLEPLLFLRPQFHALLKSAGTIVLSGLLAEQRSIIAAEYENDFNFETCEQAQEWVRLTAVKRKA